MVEPQLAIPSPDKENNMANGQSNFSLENILSDKHDVIEHPSATGDVATGPAEGWDEEDADKPPVEGYCIECEGASYVHPRLTLNHVHFLFPFFRFFFPSPRKYITALNL
jgi:hypothetical protein